MTAVRVRFWLITWVGVHGKGEDYDDNDTIQCMLQCVVNHAKYTYSMHILLFIYTNLYIHLFIYTSNYIHLFICSYTYMYTYIYTYSYTPIRIYTYIYVYTPICIYSYYTDLSSDRVLLGLQSFKTIGRYTASRRRSL